MDNYDLEEGDRTVNYIQILYLCLLLEKYLGPNPYLLVDKERLILSTGITETGHQSFRTHSTESFSAHTNKVKYVKITEFITVITKGEKSHLH